MFPLPPREAALLAEFIRVFDARLVTEGSVDEMKEIARIHGGDASPGVSMARGANASGIASGSLLPSVTEPLFPNEERAA